jgi:hypothetical protein
MQTRASSRDKYALFAALIFVAMAVWAVVRLVQGREYMGYHYDRVIDSLLLAAWAAGAVAMLVRRPWMIYFAVIGIFATFAHAFVGSLSLGWGALPYFVAFLALMICLNRTFLLFRPGMERSTEQARTREART